MVKGKLGTKEKREQPTPPATEHEMAEETDFTKRSRQRGGQSFSQIEGDEGIQALR